MEKMACSAQPLHPATHATMPMYRRDLVRRQAATRRELMARVASAIKRAVAQPGQAAAGAAARPATPPAAPMLGKRLRADSMASGSGAPAAAQAPPPKAPALLYRRDIARRHAMADRLAQLRRGLLQRVVALGRSNAQRDAAFQQELALCLMRERAWPADKAAAAVAAYEAWMRGVAQEAPQGAGGVAAVPVPPSREVATVWRAAVLHTRDYAAWCADATAGGFIPHAASQQPQGEAVDDGVAPAAAAGCPPSLTAAFRARLADCARTEHGWSVDRAEHCVAAYERWMTGAVAAAAAAAEGDVAPGAAPSTEVEAVWRAHVLHSRQYAAWCRALCDGRFVHHG